MMGRLLICFLAFVTLLSCGRPTSEEFFVKSSRAQNGVYSFELDLSDSLSVYDIYFYSAVRCPGMEVAVLWTGPDGSYFSETVYMTGCSERELYRKDAAMVIPGTWRLDVRLSNEPELFSGIGIQNVCHGTR